MDPDGNEYAHRTGVQAWIVKEMTIYVQGELPDGQYNAFAKKHLMTTAGGDSAKAKLSSISAKRRNDTIADTNAGRDAKLAAMTEFAPANAKQYVGAGAYGANGIGLGTPLTVIHCDAVTPAKLKAVFYDAIKTIRSTDFHPQVSNINGTTNQVAHVNIRFQSKIVYNQLYDRNKITETDRLSVLVMRGGPINTFHAFHGGVYNRDYPNA